MDSQVTPGSTTPFFRRSTASSLLAKFSPSHTQHKMIASPSTPRHSVRPNLPVSPAVSRGSNGFQQPELPSGQPQPVVIDLVDDGVINLDNDEIIQYTPKTQRRRPLRATTSVPRQNVSSSSGSWQLAVGIHADILIEVAQKCRCRRQR
jgi:hypothetical protein